MQVQIITGLTSCNIFDRGTTPAERRPLFSYDVVCQHAIARTQDYAERSRAEINEKQP